VGVVFQLLGDIEARVDGLVVGLGHERQRCVLVALLIEPGKGVPADVLIEHVWADRLPRNARNALSAYVSRLRRVLAVTDEARIERRPGGYALVVDPLTVDLHRFRDFAFRARATGGDVAAAELFDRALGLWRGTALGSLDTPWVNATRDGLAAERLSVETDRNDVALRLGRHAELLPELSAAAAGNPLDERLAGQLMLAFYRCGRQSEAIAHYNGLRRRLADELGVDPTTELRECYQRILTSEVPPAAPRGREGPQLLERSAALAELDAALTAGTGEVVLVSGEAGIGKSALVRRFVERHEGRVRFLVGLCDPLLTPRVLGPLRDIAGQLGGAVARRLAEGGSRDEIYSAFLDQLPTSGSTLAIVVEDAHWADAATMDLLVTLARRLDRLRVLLIVTYRDDELGTDHPLRVALATFPPMWTVRVRPAPLSVAAVAELARRAGRPAAALHAVTDGNPLLVTELLAAGEPGVPATVQALTLARLAALAQASRQVVWFIAINPTRTELWLLRAALAPVPAVVEAAVDGGLLVLTDDAIGFRHELIRQAVEESLSSLRHTELNQLALVMLSGVPGVDLARIVHHARHAGDVAALLRFAPLAAREAEAAGAHREAVNHYRAVLAHTGDLLEPNRAELLEGYAFNCYLVGAAGEALTARLSALDIWRAAGDAAKVGENLRWLSRLYWWTGRHEEAEAAAARGITVLEPEGDSRELALAYSNQADWDLLVGNLDPAIEWSRRAIAVATQVSDRETMAHALTHVGIARLQSGEAAGRADLEQAIEIATVERLPDHAARALTYAAVTSLEFRDFPQARQDLVRGLVFARDHELTGYAQYLMGVSACWRLDQGDWPGAERDARDALEHPEPPGLTVVFALVALGRLHARRGEDGAAARLTEAAERAKAMGVWQVVARVAAAHAEHAWLCGNPGRAEHAVVAGFEAALRARHPWYAGELAAWLRRAGCDVDVPAWVAEPYRCQLAGDWHGAARAWERLGCPYEQAEALTAAGDPARALEIFDRLGADAAARQLRNRV
jgi:DNA-binding SARP family transcriptional activator/tetratricopeptide (TPR) repeat protein